MSSVSGPNTLPRAAHVIVDADCSLLTITDGERMLRLFVWLPTARLPYGPAGTPIPAGFFFT